MITEVANFMKIISQLTGYEVIITKLPGPLLVIYQLISNAHQKKITAPKI